jgi:hypothetical protein
MRPSSNRCVTSPGCSSPPIGPEYRRLSWGSGVYRLVSPKLELFYMLGRSRLSRELWVRSGRGPDDPVSNRGQPDQARRTWFRLLFESQLAAYSPSAEGQANLGWYYWTCKPCPRQYVISLVLKLNTSPPVPSLACHHFIGKTEWAIDTWSYRRGVRDGYIPSDVSNASTLAYPILGNGCVDSSFNYTAPKKAGSAVGRAGGMRSVSQVVGIGLLTIILGFVAL